MTVTVEAFHQCPVDVRVLQKSITPRHYSRKILLTRQSDGQVVLFGIVRLDKSAIPAAARAEIESERAPLGRILIEHNVLREVQLVSVWEILPSKDLQRHFGMTHPQAVYGRTAMIYCNGEPAVELLEIVTPA
jgi:chorismate-pyruvate lyase